MGAAKAGQPAVGVIALKRLLSVAEDVAADRGGCRGGIFGSMHSRNAAIEELRVVNSHGRKNMPTNASFPCRDLVSY